MMNNYNKRKLIWKKSKIILKIIIIAFSCPLNEDNLINKLINKNRKIKWRTHH